MVMVVIEPSNAALQPRRPMIMSSAAGCKRLLDRVNETPASGIELWLARRPPRAPCGTSEEPRGGSDERTHQQACCERNAHRRTRGTGFRHDATAFEAHGKEIECEHRNVREDASSRRPDQNAPGKRKNKMKATDHGAHDGSRGQRQYRQNKGGEDKEVRRTSFLKGAQQARELIELQIRHHGHR